MSIPTPGSEPLIQFITDPDEISLANVPIKVVNGEVNFDLINIANRKTQIGDAGPDDHPVNSTITVRSNIGGGQVLYNRGDQDQNRYYDASTDCEHVEILALPPRVKYYEGPNQNQSVVLGQQVNDRACLASWGNKLCRYDRVGDAFSTVATFPTESPVGKAQNFAPATAPTAGLTYIPCGASYATWNGTTLTRFASPAIDFCLWQDKLIRLDPAGTVWSSFKGDNTDWAAVGHMLNGDVPRHVLPFYDRSNVFIPYAISDEHVYADDFDDAILFETDMFNPKHPYAGWGAATWRADLYVSAGLGILNQSNGFINAAGLDRDWSLPSYLAGYIVDLEPSFNHLIALVRGRAQVTSEVDISNLRLTGQETMQGAAGATISSLHAWNGFGWFKWAEFPGIPTTVFVGNPSGYYDCWWASGNLVYHRPMSPDYYNPREVVPFELALQADYTSSRFRWNWVDITKILKSLELKTINCSGDSTIDISYRFDDPDAAWITLATITDNGRHSFPFGVKTWDGQALRYGLPHEWVQLRFEFHRDPATPFVGPGIEWYTLIGRKFLKPVRTWSMRVDLQNAIKGFSEGEATALLTEIALTPGSIPFVHKDTLAMVDLTVMKGSDRGGRETSSLRDLTLVETTELTDV